MESNKEEERGDDEKQQEKQNEVVKEAPKGKSCKGYLYYSSTPQSHNRNPRCIGIPQTLHQDMLLTRGLTFNTERRRSTASERRRRAVDAAPNYLVGQSEIDTSKDGPALLDFYYACAGYSVYSTNLQDVSNDKRRAKRKLPVCVGLELLVDRKVANANADAPPAPAPAPARNREDVHGVPRPHVHNKPAHSSGDDFLSRFTRNASIVASGVARNMRRVSNHIKESVDDILYPYRKRPK